MSEIVNSLKIKKTTILTIVSLFVSIICLLLAIIFYYFPSDRKSIQYSIQNYPLLKDYIQNIDGLQILLYGNDIKNLTVSNIAIWNDGRSIIERGDVPQKNPLMVKLLSHDEEIITVKILHQTNIGNDVSVELKDNNCAIIDFEYIDRNDGFILQVIHTGNSISTNNIFGEVKSLGQINKYFNERINGRRNIIILIAFFIILFIISFLIVFFNSNVSSTTDISEREIIKVKLLASLVIGIIFVILGFLILLFVLNFNSSPIYPFKFNVPNELQRFFISN
jgi:hypothetical protein